LPDAKSPKAASKLRALPRVYPSDSPFGCSLKPRFTLAGYLKSKQASEQTQFNRNKSQAYRGSPVARYKR
jgi:hypothetical protein